jgi:hypothetical protein
MDKQTVKTARKRRVQMQIPKFARPELPNNYWLLLNFGFFFYAP